MQFYESKEQRILDPYKRVLISKVIGQIHKEISSGEFYPYATSIGFGVDIQYIEEKHMIKIMLRLIPRLNLHTGITVSTCHINPFRHTYAIRFKGQRLRMDIRKYYMSIPLGKIRLKKKYRR